MSYAEQVQKALPGEGAEAALLNLVNWLERNDVEDESADDGCGHTDTWRSDSFQRLIDQAKRVLEGAEGVDNRGIRK